MSHLRSSATRLFAASVISLYLLATPYFTMQSDTGPGYGSSLFPLPQSRRLQTVISTNATAYYITDLSFVINFGNKTTYYHGLNFNSTLNNATGATDYEAEFNAQLDAWIATTGWAGLLGWWPSVPQADLSYTANKKLPNMVYYNSTGSWSVGGTAEYFNNLIAGLNKTLIRNSTLVMQKLKYLNTISNERMRDVLAYVNITLFANNQTYFNRLYTNMTYFFGMENQLSQFFSGLNIPEMNLYYDQPGTLQSNFAGVLASQNRTAFCQNIKTWFGESTGNCSLLLDPAYPYVNGSYGNITIVCVGCLECVGCQGSYNSSYSSNLTYSNNSYFALNSGFAYNSFNFSNSQYLWGSSFIYDSSNIRNSNYSYNSSNINGSAFVWDSSNVADSSYIRNGQWIFFSRNLNNSRYMYYSTNVSGSSDSSYVIDSQGIAASSYVQRSSNVSRGYRVYDSSNIVASNNTNGSSQVENSDNVVNSTLVFRSYNVFNSRNVSNSNWTTGSTNVSGSFNVTNSRNVFASSNVIGSSNVNNVTNCVNCNNCTNTRDSKDCSNCWNCVNCVPVSTEVPLNGTNGANGTNGTNGTTENGTIVIGSTLNSTVTYYPANSLYNVRVVGMSGVAGSQSVNRNAIGLTFSRATYANLASTADAKIQGNSTVFTFPFESNVGSFNVSAIDSCLMPLLFYRRNNPVQVNYNSANPYDLNVTADGVSLPSVKDISTTYSWLLMSSASQKDASKKGDFDPSRISFIDLSESVPVYGMFLCTVPFNANSYRVANGTSLNLAAATGPRAGTLIKSSDTNSTMVSSQTFDSKDDGYLTYKVPPSQTSTRTIASTDFDRKISFKSGDQTDNMGMNIQVTNAQGQVSTKTFTFTKPNQDWNFDLKSGETATINFINNNRDKDAYMDVSIVKIIASNATKLGLGLGIGLGGAALLLILLGICYCCWKRKKNQEAARKQDFISTNERITAANDYPKMPLVPEATGSVGGMGGTTNFLTTESNLDTKGISTATGGQHVYTANPVSVSMNKDDPVFDWRNSTTKQMDGRYEIERQAFLKNNGITPPSGRDAALGLNTGSTGTTTGGAYGGQNVVPYGSNAGASYSVTPGQAQGSQLGGGSYQVQAQDLYSFKNPDIKGQTGVASYELNAGGTAAGLTGAAYGGQRDAVYTSSAGGFGGVRQTTNLGNEIRGRYDEPEGPGFSIRSINTNGAQVGDAYGMQSAGVGGGSYTVKTGSNTGSQNMAYGIKTGTSSNQTSEGSANQQVVITTNQAGAGAKTSAFAGGAKTTVIETRDDFFDRDDGQVAFMEGERVSSRAINSSKAIGKLQGGATVNDDFFTRDELAIRGGAGGSGGYSAGATGSKYAMPTVYGDATSSRNTNDHRGGMRVVMNQGVSGKQGISTQNIAVASSSGVRSGSQERPVSSGQFQAMYGISGKGPQTPPVYGVGSGDSYQNGDGEYRVRSVNSGIQGPLGEEIMTEWREAEPAMGFVGASGNLNDAVRRQTNSPPRNPAVISSDAYRTKGESPSEFDRFFNFESPAIRRNNRG